MRYAKHEGDALIEQVGALFDKIRATEFPRLEEEAVIEDGGETFTVLHCPRCNDIVEAEDLYAVDFSERWSHADGLEEGYASFHPGDADYESTVWYQHDGHAVRLPSGWTEEWL